ncbi:MAG: DNA-directed polymerase subunit beta [Patescibacteria group bacterium]|nr:DNA-directed polymerase subunit beta [Patescibacteria group bacterium]
MSKTEDINEGLLVANLPKKTFSKFKKPFIELPNLVENQIASFKKLVEEDLDIILKELNPINDYTEKKFELEIKSFELGDPKYDEEYAKNNKLTYEAPLRATFVLHNKILNTKKEQEIFMASFPVMTVHGTFIVNGVERVIIPQLARSAGEFFDFEEISGKKYFSAKIVPNRGAWIEFLTDDDNEMFVKIDKKRKFSVISLLRAIGYHTDKEISAAFEGKDLAKAYIMNIVEKDPIKTADEAYIDVYKKLRDGDLATTDNAKSYILSLFGKERYDLSPIGRLRFNKRFNLSSEAKEMKRLTLSKEDIVLVIAHLIELNNDPDAVGDDIDHLASRRVRFVGEMLGMKIKKGMLQVRRYIQEKMSVVDTDTTLPVAVINQRPLQARIKEFFTVNQLSHLMNQENLLAEIESLRTVSALGPGGLSKERAGFEVRDVHTSHYGRVCPIHTPDGANVGLILRLATYAKINEFGIIETPYVKVKNGKITNEIEYLNALQEESTIITHAVTPYDEKGEIINEFVEARKFGNPAIVTKKEVEYIDVATNQAYSIATSMIPFLEHDDAVRASLGSNMQKQALPLLLAEAPYVSTGMEGDSAKHIGRVVLAEEAGEVKYIDARKVTIKNKEGKDKVYNLVDFTRTNNFTAFYQRPIVNIGDKVKKGDVLADSSSTRGGQISIGHNIRVAFMSWNGANYEDAIIISEKLVREKKFSSIHIEEFVCSVRDTKLGPEITTHDIPNVGEAKLKNLDEEGIIRVGADVRAGDILIGKITPKGETELTPEERLLRSIFGEKIRDVKDTSLRLDNGKRGRVIGIKVFSREKGDTLESGVIKRIHIEVAQLRDISVGDKLAGRHGNKGVISRILPTEDMPFTEDGEPIDIILTPLGVPSRMNLGQILEMHLGLAAKTLGYQSVVPVFNGATEIEIKEELVKAGFDPSGTVDLFDGRTGDKFAEKVAIGIMYMLKLHHMVEDKIHARSIGPYSLITQQPLGGKSQNGGQRFGEMEVWALEGYGAAHTLREVLTIKSDDIVGRSDAFNSIIKNEEIKEPNTPASLNVLLNTLRGLSLDIIPLVKEEKKRGRKLLGEEKVIEIEN